MIGKLFSPALVTGPSFGGAFKVWGNFWGAFIRNHGPRLDLAVPNLVSFQTMLYSIGSRWIMLSIENCSMCPVQQQNSQLICISITSTAQTTGVSSSHFDIVTVSSVCLIRKTLKVTFLGILTLFFIFPIIVIFNWST